MLISHSRKFIFIHVYKVAGMSIRSALDEYASKPDIINRVFYKLGLNLRSPFQKNRMFAFHATARDLERGLPDEIYNNYFKFAFVRNPWDWQVSLYQFMLDSPDHFQYEIVKSMSSFEGYVEWRIYEDKRLQKDFVTNQDGKIIVDFVGRYERLDLDFEHICQRISIQKPLPHLNPSKHGDYRGYYNDRSKKMVEEHFAEDIELFGYSFEGLVEK